MIGRRRALQQPRRLGAAPEVDALVGRSRAGGRTDHHEKELALSAWTDETNDHGSPLIDLQGLQKVFDTNHGGVLDSQDARWNEFRVRHDLNQNCGVDESELRTMSEAGIKLIALIPSPAGAMAFDDGSAITGTSRYEAFNGSLARAGEYADHRSMRSHRQGQRQGC